MDALVKLLSSFSAGALTMLLGASVLGIKDRETLIAVVMLSGLVTAGGHALPSALPQSPESKNIKEGTAI